MIINIIKKILAFIVKYVTKRDCNQCIYGKDADINVQCKNYRSTCGRINCNDKDKCLDTIWRCNFKRR